MALRKCRARSEDRVGIDVAADFARDIAFARRDQRERDESGFQACRPRMRGKRADAACRRYAVARPARMAATLSISSRIEIVCSACQRLNGSLSCAARKARSSADKIGDELDRRREAAVDRQAPGARRCR